MSYTDSARVEHERKRWLRPDWQRWVRHDAHLFAPPDPKAYRSYASRLIEQRKAEEEEARLAAAQDATREDLLRMRRELTDIKFELALRRIFRKYDPDQPRIQAGNPGGGQWTGNNATPNEAPTEFSAARRRSGISEAQCDAQYDRDMITCRLVRTPLCYAQAMARRAACIGGYPLPPLNF